mmetsp:Transcript_19826/g.27886  ORF Transcript_19826/g.27886 Transcript_19826/m.27886 type:complete len:532 (-) Transcript_19826:91-1686(-)
MSLVSGISERLKSGIFSVRKDGMLVAEQLGPILGQDVRFDELDGEREDNDSTIFGQRQDDDYGKDMDSCHTNNLSREEKPDRIHANKGSSFNKPTATTTKRTKRKEVQTPKEMIDPDEEYLSEDERDDPSIPSSEYDPVTDVESISGRGNPMDAFFDEDSDWDEDDMIPYSLEDNEEDMEAVPKPNYLRECLTLLRTGEDDTFAVDRHTMALKEISTLVRAKPPDLTALAETLTQTLLHFENKYDLKNFGEYRFEGLCALAVCEPERSVKLLIRELFLDISLAVRFDILDVIKYTCSELSGNIRLEHHKAMRNEENSKINAPKIMGKRSVVAQSNLISDLESDEVGITDSNNSITRHISALENKTRRWGRSRRNEISVVNKLIPLAPSFFYTLVKSFMVCRSNTSIWDGENGEHLLSKVIVTMCTIVDNVGNNPSVSVLASDLFDLSWSFREAESSEVRIAILVSLATAMAYLPQEYLTKIFFGSHRNVASGELQRFLENTSLNDPDERCRRVAAQLTSTSKRLYPDLVGI